MLKLFDLFLIFSIPLQGSFFCAGFDNNWHDIHTQQLTFSSPSLCIDQPSVGKPSVLARNMYSFFNCLPRMSCVALPIIDRMFSEEIHTAYLFLKHKIGLTKTILSLSLLITNIKNKNLYTGFIGSSVFAALSSTLIHNHLKKKQSEHSDKPSLWDSFLSWGILCGVTTPLFVAWMKDIPINFEITPFLNFSAWMAALLFNGCYAKNIAEFSSRFNSSIPACFVSYMAGWGIKHIILGSVSRSASHLFSENDLSKFYKSFAKKALGGVTLGALLQYINCRFNKFSFLSKLKNIETDFPFIGFIMGSWLCFRQDFPDELIQK